MVFKQGVLKEEKIKFVITAISVFLPYAIITILSFIYKDDVRLLFEFLLVCFFPTYLLVILLCIF